MRTWIDPRKITEPMVPLIIGVDDRSGTFFSSQIKSHSKSEYNHFMEMRRPGYFATQDVRGGFHEVPIDVYLKPQFFLKFFQPILTPEEKCDWMISLAEELIGKTGPTGYDRIGLIGQLLSSMIPIPPLKQWLRKINNPWKKYCTERASARPRKILNIPICPHPNPADLNDALNNSDKIRVFGYWWLD